jgi:hypothetical protein
MYSLSERQTKRAHHSLYVDGQSVLTGHCIEAGGVRRHEMFNDRMILRIHLQ